MNKWPAFFFLIIVIVSCTNTKTKQLANNHDEVGAPKFVVQPEFHNFGLIESGEVVSFSFKYSNNGSGLLKIDSVDGGCGCIDVVLEQQNLKPEESSYMQVTFNSAGEWGNIYKPILIYTNTEKTKHEISITAKVNNQLFKNK